MHYQKPAPLTASAAMTLPGKLISKNADNFTLYPNPANSFINVQSAGEAAFVLMDQAGKTVLTKTINGYGQISIAHLPAGLYYLQNSTTGIKQKVMIE